MLEMTLEDVIDFQNFVEECFTQGSGRDSTIIEMHKEAEEYLPSGVRVEEWKGPTGENDLQYVTLVRG